jgi:hypothetical protein
LILAFTTPRDEWVLPQDTSLVIRDVETEAARLSKSITPLRDEEFGLLTLDLSEVLTALWYHGVHPSTAGQVIVRPRMVESDWPPDPERQRFLTKPFWLVQALGSVTTFYPGDWPRYGSGRLLLIRDDDIEISLGLTLP